VVTAANREDELSRKFALLAPVLDERQRRLWMAVEAREAGHGGITMGGACDRRGALDGDSPCGRTRQRRNRFRSGSAR
jgi:hypothetical protein